MADLAIYSLKTYKDGQFVDFAELKKKSDTGKIVIVHEDATNYVYEDVLYQDVATLYAMVCGNQGMYVMREVGSGDENIRRFECETSDSQLNESEVVCAYDSDDDAIYSVSYLDCDENDIFMTSETVGKEDALNMLELEINGDEDVVRVDK